MAQIVSTKNIGRGQMIIFPLCDNTSRCSFTDECPRAWYLGIWNFFFGIPKFDQVNNCQKAAQIGSNSNFFEATNLGTRQARAWLEINGGSWRGILKHDFRDNCISIFWFSYTFTKNGVIAEL